ncbi:STN and carboxypeptidase regulatory-like domain-containing protein [Mucilaginibacter aquaedulcis]|uniref:STN and carboxypeptidase regulatory-like domain-containing protein n=1 Tax=Mucilaginibacter aquaedulcis TaxID=1187081 RepID=UPI0025B62896|nr:STN and carboxypeptidase regulatory-like domain-containing protein [Mucilaginibacter aquaedulcis]MDN3549190.1 STN and carboxypeptidase regulatory-like domain-containing protein [Mucilaginibacter aquaedulcis]
MRPFYLNKLPVQINIYCLYKHAVPKYLLLIWVFIYCSTSQLFGQTILEKQITLHEENMRLADLLDEIGRQGQFFFSYDSQLIPKDSTVTIQVTEKKIAQVLTQIFSNRFAYEERKNYLIITPKLRSLTLSNTDFTDESDNYSISGLVTDERTGERLMNASVYEKQQLASTLTDDHGYFRLKLKKNNDNPVRITVSKLRYRDTMVTFLQAVSVTYRNDSQTYENSRTKNNRVERTALGSWLISARQKIQSLNIPDFFAKRPFQVSLTPGLSTHGMFSPQVVNNFSLNLAGGYTAGVKGFEIGGLFNINKENSEYLQMAGIFNLVGGNMTGLQIAGVDNVTLDTLRGAQLSLFINRAEAEANGLQLGLLHNSTKHLKGVQLGLVNVTDTSQGISIGLINIVHNGFYQIAYSANNMASTNITFKSGTHDFYTTLLVSANTFASQKLFAAGLGAGHDFKLRRSLYISAEGNFRIPISQTWDERWMQAKLMLNARISKHFSIMAGPSLNRYSYIWSNPSAYRQNNNANDYYTQTHGLLKTSIGWEAGIAYNSVFQKAPKSGDRSDAWSIGIAATAGLTDLSSYGQFVPGLELAVYRDLGSGLSGYISTGYNKFPSAASHKFDSEEENYYRTQYSYVPLKGGVRYMLSRIFYIDGALGVAFRGDSHYSFSKPSSSDNINRNIPAASSLMYGLSAGFTFRNGLETGIKKDVYRISGADQQYALRLGYRFKL